MSILASLAAIIVAIFALALLTDKFFIPSLDKISRRLQLSDEVAGASLMAIGSSAPELAIALLALFTSGGAHSDVGIGTIVGSAVFNILVITGLSAVVAGGFRVHIFAVRRDIIAYLVAIGYLALVFSDGQVAPMEALAGLGLYGVYLIVLARLQVPQKADDLAERPPPPAPPSHDHPSPSAWRRVEALLASLLRLITGDPHQHYLRAFVVSIALIVLLSYLLVEATIVFATGIGIPPVIVALTLLAAGTSAPDLMSSLEVARAGRGGMALANAVGSNTFDLLIGLGLPWIIAMSVLGESSIHVGTDDLWMSIGMLVITTLILFIFLEIQRLLSRRGGWLLLLLYGGFILYTLLA
ncbi:MAG: calcium/sodium antiporter [Chloroflexi bacterium]|nr:calcium/sodium antiporter [Chloroflexota bacterium]MCY4247840.1 calcium/sodium antiporter [Chloroflexota bacterium]